MRQIFASGLDASTALNWAQAVRTITDVLGISSIMTLYQAGNGKSTI